MKMMDVILQVIAVWFVALSDIQMVMTDNTEHLWLL